MIDAVCATCSKAITIFPSKLRVTGKNFCSAKCRKIRNYGNRNGQWKGNKVGYIALHEWVKNRFPKPELCNICKEPRPLDLANISQKYKRNIKDWEWLCRRCHMTKDGRLNNLKQFNQTL